MKSKLELHHETYTAIRVVHKLSAGKGKQGKEQFSRSFA